jgi:protoporphyrinogen oxidase
VQVGRIQNFGSWSPFLVKDGRTCLGLEFFVNVGDETWNRSDADLIAQGTAELEKLGLVRGADVEQGFVVRMPKAYPFYEPGYKEKLQVIRDWMDEHTPNLHPVGRNGMFQYNNQDHSMLTAMLTVQNIADGTAHDVWSVNVDEDYHEAGSAPSVAGGRATGHGAAPVRSGPERGA